MTRKVAVLGLGAAPLRPVPPPASAERAARRRRFQGAGVKLNLPRLSEIIGPVTVHLHRSGGGPCFGATSSAPFQFRDASRLQDGPD